MYYQVGFNSQPPEGGWAHSKRDAGLGNSFNSQPPEGGWLRKSSRLFLRTRCFNSQPPEGGWVLNLKFFMLLVTFQLTAARRRLDRR